MKNSIFIFGLSLGLFYSQVCHASFSSWKDPNACGNMTISSLQEFRILRKPILEHLWKNSLISCDNSPLVDCFKNQIWTLLKSNDTEVYDFAEICVITFAILSPYMDENPITCYTAQMIDASISCMVGKDCSSIISSLTSSESSSIRNFYACLFNYMYLNGLSRVEECVCEEDEVYSRSADVQCEGSGFVYNIDEMWELKGGFLPPSLRRLVRRLYDSCDHRDRFLANMATFRLSEFSCLARKGFNPKIVYEFLYLQYAPMNDHFCCDERKQRLKYLKSSVESKGKINTKYLVSFHENKH